MTGLTIVKVPKDWKPKKRTYRSSRKARERPSRAFGHKAYQSLSLGFNMPDRSIVFTGSTGPCNVVQALAKGADLLVSEITDHTCELAALKAERRDLPFLADPVRQSHFENQHLTADAVGELAAGASVRSLVLTHNPMPDDLILQARATIARHYGRAAFANDLDNY